MSLSGSVGVVGGGAAGLMAAIAAGRSGARVALFERNDRVGKKILVTGNGRCNMTNRVFRREYFHGDTDFAMAVTGVFSPDQTLSFFGELGVEFSEEDNGRVFPRSMQAGSVLDALRFEAGRLGAEFYTGFRIGSVKKTARGFEAVSSAGKSFSFDRVILACGGMAAPATGSDGSGLALARSLGHSVTECYPALVQLKLDGDGHRAMERMMWEGEIRAVSRGKVLSAVRGDILFTHYGVSGTAALSVSRSVIGALNGNDPVSLEIGLLPDLTENEILRKLSGRREANPTKPLEDFLSGWINKRIGQTLLKSLGHKMTGLSGGLSDADLKKIAGRMARWEFPVSGHTGWPNAQTTAGGVRTDEFDPSTMESKIVPGLHMAGEMLDVDGDSGGYNLQWAWSSGWVAGRAAAAASADSGGTS